MKHNFVKIINNELKKAIYWVTYDSEYNVLKTIRLFKII